MLLGQSRLTIHGVMALVGASALLCPALRGNPIKPTPAPPSAPVHVSTWTPDLSLYNYPPITPATTLNARSITELIHLKTATGLPKYPTPNEWFPLDLYQGTITREQFEQKLHRLYDPFSAFAPYLDINDSRVVIYPAPQERRCAQFVLDFAPPNQPRPPMRWFRTPEEFRAEIHPLGKPLNGLRVAIDPGHIGGPWAQMEERSTRYRGSAPVQEGDLNLITGRLLKQELTQLGASVFVVRDSTEPVTPYRPDDMLPQARELLLKHSSHITSLSAMPPDSLNLVLGHRLIDLAEFLFYRCSEIEERGNRIRNNFVPDITVTLYIDATPGSGRGHLTTANANIFFVHGSYTKSEIADAGMRQHCIYKMVEGSSDIEAEVAASIANVFTQKTGLKPVGYGDSNTTRQVIPGNSYVVARNLAANREYAGPVVCTEPYFMNNDVVYQRLLAGDYEGEKTFNGKNYGSIFREYADCVAQGLVRAYASPTVIAGANNVPTSSGQAK
jgi:N-acetylmuramoyl-L-alanine amidase